MNQRTIIIIATITAGLATVLWVQPSVAQRRGGGGGGGGGRMSGFRAPSASRNIGHAPAMSRPSMPHPSVNRPSAPRPSAPRPSAPRPSAIRPSAPRPSAPQQPVTRPATRPQLPSGGIQKPNLGNSPNGNRPNTTLPNINRPGNNKPSYTRPGGSTRPSLPGNERPGIGSGITKPGGINSPGGITKPGGITRPNPGGIAKPLPGGGPSGSQLDDFLGIKRPSRPGGATTLPGIVGDKRPGLGGDKFPGLDGDKRPGVDGDRFPGIDGDRRPGIGDGNRPNLGNIGSNNINVGNVNVGNKIDFSKDRNAWIDQRHEMGDRVRVNAGGRYAFDYRYGNYRRGVTGGFVYYRGWGGDPFYGWRRPTRVAFAAYLGAAWFTPTPVYYAYGTGGNVYYENNTVYVNGEAAGTPEAYAQDAISIAASAPAPPATEAAAGAADASTQPEEEWLPLGVFAYTKEGVDDSQAMIELAVNKQGVLAGTYYNEATKVSRSLKGSIDKDSRRAVVGFADGENTDTVLEMGVDNLTEDEVSALLHRGTEESEPVLLVRLEAPEE
ncbi:hypothetical protein [Stieleria varia]|uniref:Uncharacterized protein n=1 Tax=Stieleria varia TaxID=2528005 RepID=A0A5C6AX91_9BACT|nr:hypothetical protein [Stieleria varia]TWU04350.1 hypothetical protein Pla52n_23900 [Stieleria varia]